MNDAIPSPATLDDLEMQLEQLLVARPPGISEHELLKILRREQPLFAAFDAREPLGLFRGHYLLFHVLYRLRHRLARERRGHLTIDPLRIALEPPTVAEPGGKNAALAPGGSDLADWYADLGRLMTVTAAQVGEWLRQFHTAHRAGEQRRAALAVLELRDPVDVAAIRRQYRRLAMRHHPDRGGDGQRLREIHAALAALAGGRARFRGG
ncbi:MAG: DNA-J related domain-containing protein [Candidatus Contendobacter sp.]|nr:DNA-J related domain-containing protein [Candidatus Contendobacter sp.]